MCVNDKNNVKNLTWKKMKEKKYWNDKKKILTMRICFYLLGKSNSCGKHRVLCIYVTLFGIESRDILNSILGVTSSLLYSSRRKNGMYNSNILFTTWTSFYSFCAFSSSSYCIIYKKKKKKEQKGKRKREKKILFIKWRNKFIYLYY